MSNYLLMAGEDYYPCGPDDIVGFYKALEEANTTGVKTLETTAADWFAIIDIEKGAMIGSQVSPGREWLKKDYIKG